jgi:hypothetical protein
MKFDVLMTLNIWDVILFYKELGKNVSEESATSIFSAEDGRSMLHQNVDTSLPTTNCHTAEYYNLNFPYNRS